MIFLGTKIKKKVNVQGITYLSQKTLSKMLCNTHNL